jgi:hypothetical protein
LLVDNLLSKLRFYISNLQQHEFFRILCNFPSYCIVFHISLAKTVVAIALAMVLIFSGFLLRSFGKGKEEGLGNE